jgi:hypothetical protein
MPVRVYKFSFDTQNFRSLALAPDQDPSLIAFNGSQRQETWQPLKVQCPDSAKPLDDFYGLHPSCLVARPRAKKLLGAGYFEAEYLPLIFDDEPLFIINFTACRTILDVENSQVERDPATNQICRIRNYAFHPRRFPRSSVFKIAECDSQEMFCYRGVKDAKDEFYNRVHSRKLTGLIFEEVWTVRDIY